MHKGIFPAKAKPAAVEAIFCSAMPISKCRSGNSAWNITDWVDFPKSASSVTMSWNFFPRATKAEPYAARRLFETAILLTSVP